MNWLTPFCQEIDKQKNISRGARDTAILWASELSAICDLYVKLAPILQLENIHDHEGDELKLSWFWLNEQRSFTLSVGDGVAPTLILMDGTRNEVTDAPSHDKLKRAVQCFFEGWSPRV